MQDDKNNIDDFDNFDDVEDFDDIELGDDVSYDDDDDLSEFDDMDEDSEMDGDASIDESLIAKDKKDSILSKFSFNQLVIGGAVIVGAGFFIFQLATSEPPPRPEQFQSAVNMSGSNDNMVFGENQQTGVTETQSNTDLQNNKDGGLLNNSKSLDSLQIDFEEDVPMPVPISQEGQLDDEDILIQNAQNNSALNANVDIAEEFQTVPRAPEMNIPSGFEGEVFGEIEQQQPPSTNNNELNNIDLVDSELTPAPMPSFNTPEEIQISDNNNIVLEADPVLAPDLGNERIQAQPLNKIKREQALEETPINVIEPSQIVATQVSDNTQSIEKIAVLESQVKEITLEKDREITQLNKTVDDLKKQLEQMQSELKKDETQKTAGATAPAKPAPVKQKAAPQEKQPVKPVSVSKKSVQWELRAAQPGKAWVSQKGREDLQPVVVGDTLSGLGRITSISFNNNRWIVSGQNGSIKQ